MQLNSVARKPGYKTKWNSARCTSAADTVVVTVVHTVSRCGGRRGSQRAKHSSSLPPDDITTQPCTFYSSSNEFIAARYLKKCVHTMVYFNSFGCYLFAISFRKYTKKSARARKWKIRLLSTYFLKFCVAAQKFEKKRLNGLTNRPN